MLIPIILFGIGLVGTIVILFLQGRKLHSGKVELSYAQITEPKIKINVKNVRESIWQLCRAIVHIIIMKILRLWAIVSHYISKKWSEKFGKKNNGADEEEFQKRESFFLHSIGEYKNKLNKIKQKLKEKDENHVINS